MDDTGVSLHHDAAIDRAAKHLRDTQQSGKRLTPWEDTPRATKRKWVALAEGTLEAAYPGGRLAWRP